MECCEGCGFCGVGGGREVWGCLVIGGEGFVVVEVEEFVFDDWIVYGEVYVVGVVDLGEVFVGVLIDCGFVGCGFGFGYLFVVVDEVEGVVLEVVGIGFGNGVDDGVGCVVVLGVIVVGDYYRCVFMLIEVGKVVSCWCVVVGVD